MLLVWMTEIVTEWADGTTQFEQVEAIAPATEANANPCILNPRLSDDLWFDPQDMSFGKPSLQLRPAVLN